MESLLDQADALVLSAGEEGPERPNFVIPEELANLTTPNSNWLEVRENPNKGKGWFSKVDVPVGSTLMVCKALVCALDLDYIAAGDEECGEMEDNDEHDDMDQEDEAQGSTVNELLVLDILQNILDDPPIWIEQLTNLYPREEVDIKTSPVWISKDDEVFSQFEAMIEQIENVPVLKGKSKEISERLPLIIRYNVLSIETCPELLSHPGPNGHHSLSGVGLYYWPSFFNHDSRPNVSRYAVGDIMWFVANKNIAAGQELCLSYLEQDVLCENSYRRNCMLTLDFKEDEDPDLVLAAENDDGGPSYPVVDDDVQNELMAMNPFERLEAIDELMQQAVGETLPTEECVVEDDDRMDANGSAWFQCDLQNLRILKAITLEGSGQSEKALQMWEECVEFTDTKMPPNDENSIVMRVQAAMCAINLNKESLARNHAAIALQKHNLMFGGGVRRFRRRYRQDFRLNLRLNSGHESFEATLWPYE
mmetsp:Transcript_8856/g.18528  ORF Transcript_8856/g.18528 Transcript_8856/m.18528 type:complete len:478 (+) Transcript_8856:73-1506(+)|eukprot:CAMPEP_0201199370 /NCGR_PEP_ID=MMETSP0851-20130426/158743_1 /ASSEMBLY_ACC=CAM_ASM_000631 /TAXON_ID=183588 /ORGANISM="Pseudo-nitzschia fraudulenta, Strain WWA7" /LENGTH=477 /DNA_ID=CAMNT_0047486759 /DNA_START=57 /DNA_END=1490 /DNA_ORIENTATION=+